MGLLTTYDDNNKVVMNDKVVTYSQQRIYGEWTYKYGVSELITIYQAWEVHRYCAKSYMYVGMDKTTANRCAQAMVTKYTRPFRISQWNGDGTYAGTFTDIDGGSVCMADIAIQQREGCMYDVVINVREDDARLRTNVTSNPSSLFTTENARDYDD